MGSPEVFAELLGRGVNISRYDIVEKHVNLLRNYLPENFISGHIRKHLLWYLKGYAGAGAIKLQISTEPDIDKVLEIMRKFMENL